MAGDSLALFRSRNPQVRVGVAAVGVFQYARSRLRGGDWTNFIAALRALKLPETAVDVRDHPNPKVVLHAIVDLIFGLSQGIDQSTVDNYHFRVGGTLTVPGGGSCGGAINGGDDVDSNADLLGTNFFAEGDLQGTTFLAVASSLISGGVTCGTPDSATVESGVVKLGAEVFTPEFTIRETQQTVQAAAEPSSDLGAPATSIFINPREGLEAVKAAALANDNRVVLTGPTLDTGWFEIVAHRTGDNLVNPPYEITYPLGIQIPFGSPGDRLGLTRYAVWVRHVEPGVPTPYASQVTQYIASTSGGYRGISVWIDSNGQLTLRLAHNALRPEATVVVDQVRVFLWPRGTN